MRNLRASLFCGFGVRRDRGSEELGRGTREGNGMRRGGTRAGFKVWLEGVSCVGKDFCQGIFYPLRNPVLFRSMSIRLVY